MKIKETISILLATILLSGCNITAVEEDTLAAIDLEVQAILEDASISEPAPVFTESNVFGKSISLVLEGIAPEGTMMALADVIAEKNIDTIMFIPATEAQANPDLIKYIKNKGVELGNYGLTGEEELSASSDTKIARQMYLSNEYIKEITWSTPDYFYGTRSEYTETMLKIATAVGLEGVVQPNIFLNYKSFTDKEMVLDYTSRDLRGDVISIKLTGELNDTEVPSTTEKDETPAVDKQPTIDIEKDEVTEESTTMDIVDMVTWFIEGCMENQVEILSLQELQKENISTPEPKEVEQALLDKLDIGLYPTLTTEFTFGLQAGEKVDHSYFDNTVFVGDSIMEYIESYVNQKRQSNSAYLGNAKFLAMGGLSARNALWEISDSSRHPIYEGERVTIQDGIKAMGNIEKVYIMLGLNDTHLTDTDTHLKNYQTLLQLIAQQSPQVEFYIISITPGTNEEELTPNNHDIFDRNLSLIKWCAAYEYNYVDVATALRNEEGALPKSLCVDEGGQGYHLNETGINIFWEYIYTHTN